ncbi:terminase small subunit [Corynebacterium jeikeium]|uniref:terminase small subunit n=1 Tax=Corynebacterium macclintockiae TaxID=2913501 RepID=UPI0005B335EE
MQQLSDVVRVQPVTGRMRASVQESVDAAEHLIYADEADVELAFQLADIIDAARDSGDEERLHKVSYGPMPTLHKVLTSLGLNPEGRQKLGLDDQDEDEDW